MRKKLKITNNCSILGVRNRVSSILQPSLNVESTTTKTTIIIKSTDNNSFKCLKFSDHVKIYRIPLKFSCSK